MRTVWLIPTLGIAIALLTVAALPPLHDRYLEHSVRKQLDFYSQSRVWKLPGFLRKGDRYERLLRWSFVVVGVLAVTLAAIGLAQP